MKLRFQKKYFKKSGTCLNSGKKLRGLRAVRSSGDLFLLAPPPPRPLYYYHYHFLPNNVIRLC